MSHRPDPSWNTDGPRHQPTPVDRPDDWGPRPPGPWYGPVDAPPATATPPPPPPVDVTRFPPPQGEPYLPGPPYGPGWGPAAPPYREQPSAWPAPYAPWPAPSAPAPPSRDDRTWAAAAHWLPLVSHWLGPLGVYLTIGERNAWVRAEAVESLNFEITVALGMAVSFLLMSTGIGVVTAVALLLCSIFFHLRGSRVASRGGHYRYPFALRIVKPT